MKELTINGAVVQADPLTAAQRIHYYTVMRSQRDELLNIATGFYLEYGETDFDTLRECILEGYRKFESMRLRFAKDEEGNLYQYLVPTEDRYIPLVDFRAWKEEDAHDEMRRWSRLPFHMNGGPMSDIRMIRLPNNYDGVYMRVHHMTMDSSSGMMLTTLPVTRLPTGYLLTMSSQGFCCFCLRPRETRSLTSSILRIITSIS